MSAFPLTGSKEAYDFIIVGAGSAGCVLANRLSEDGSSVLLLEAGTWDRDPFIHIPIGIGKIFPERMHDWGYFMQPDVGLDGRAIECARGRIVGGCSSVNVMVYMRGNRGDYERWASSGLEDWSYERVLPYFKKAETWEEGGNAFRGGDGPLKVRYSRYEDPLLASFIEAGAQAGHAEVRDYNAEQQEGMARIQQTIHRGRRCSAAAAYLRPAMNRKSLRVVVKALVTKVIIEGHRAVGVNYRREGKTHVVRALREVILCGGVINSPQILMLSGIGDPAQLKAQRIPVEVENPAVGRNLRDHLSVMLTHRRADKGPFEPAMRYDRLVQSMIGSWLGAETFASDVPTGVTGFVKTTPRSELPDVQFLFLAAPLPCHPWLRPFISPVSDTFGCRVVLLRPESTGRITLASADPAAAPLIAPNFLAEPSDRETLRSGIRILRRIIAQPAMAAHRGIEIAPGTPVSSDDELDAFVRRTSVTVHHPVGTCRMGASHDDERVVDPQLRVCGVDGLRVVDASVMPDLVGGNINGVVMMIAEKAADMIRA